MNAVPVAARVTVAVNSGAVRCPYCRAVVAIVESGVIVIKQRGRKYRMTPGSAIERCYCEDCREWFAPGSVEAE